MALDPRYVTTLELQSYFVDKQTGLPLAGGVVYFWHDNNRNDPKAVYQLSGSPPNYTYTALPNPLTLTNAGTFSDGSTNDISVYYYPYDAAGQPDNYYVQVFAEPIVPPFPPVGTPIITREAVPGVTADTGPGAPGPSSTENEMINSQFATVLFDPLYGMNVVYTNATTDVTFAPGWGIRIVATGGGTVTINRVSIAGSSNFDTNPPYYLQVDPGAGGNISSIIVYQRLSHNPNIFASGYVSAGIALAPTPAPGITMYYAPNGTQVVPPLLTFANTTGSWEFASDTTLLDIGNNAVTSDTGYVEIQIALSTGSISKFTSVQVVSLATNEENIPYNQQPVIQQQNQTFFYNQPLLEYKPIPSYLVGWDFPLNPAQFEGDTVGPKATGVNKSFYAWDQTLIYQTATNGVIASRAINGGLLLTGQTAGQVAIVQYLDQIEARKILANRASVHLNASTSLASLVGTISLWATDDAQLPNAATGTNNSIVLTLDANGKPASKNGNWTEITRGSFGDAKFTLGTSTQDIEFSQWNINGNALANTATYFAIVIGFAAFTTPDTITINTVGLCAGDIATPPAPKTFDETLSDCERYYEKSYAQGVLPGTITLTNALIAQQQCSTPEAVSRNIYFLNNGFSYEFKTPKRVTNSTVSHYSPNSGTVARFFLKMFYSNAYPTTADINVSYWGTVTIGDKRVNLQPTETVPGVSFVSDGGQPQILPGSFIMYHYVADARLGILL